MAQTVSRRPFPTKDRVRPGSIRVGFAVDRVAMGQVFFPSFSVFSVNIIPPWLSMVIYRLGHEQVWPQYRDVVSPHRPDHEQHILTLRWI
jgi:hypothetical protein